jgi:hypothetical protein
VRSGTLMQLVAVNRHGQQQLDIVGEGAESLPTGLQIATLCGCSGMQALLRVTHGQRLRLPSLRHHPPPERPKQLATPPSVDAVYSSTTAANVQRLAACETFPGDARGPRPV